jgi:hypothetical protein
MIASISFKRAVLVVGSVVNDAKGMINCLSASITDVLGEAYLQEHTSSFYLQCSATVDRRPDPY